MIQPPVQNADPLPDLVAGVRQGDRARFLAGLFSPEPARGRLNALLAFNLEIGRIPAVASQPMIGEIRLQWWRDALEEIAGGRPPRGHEILVALAPVVQAGTVMLPALVRLIDARVHDLYEDPMPDMAAVLDYADATGGELAVQAGRILGAGPEAEGVARHVGTAWALMGLLRSLRWQAEAGRCYLPADRLAAEGVALADVLARRPGPGLARVVAEVAEVARQQLAAARAQRRCVPRAVLPAVLMAPLIDRFLARLAASGDDPFRSIELPPWQAPVLIGLAALRGRF